MLYRVTIDGTERDVEVRFDPDGRVEVRLDSERVDVEVERVPGGVTLHLAGQIIDLAIGGPPEAMTVAAGGARAVVTVMSERELSRAKKSGSMGDGANEVRAPMPGRVVKVLVEVGQEVAAGDPCVVIEAMKMENELGAPGPSKVAKIHVEAGQSVEGRALLLTLEPTDSVT